MLQKVLDLEGFYLNRAAGQANRPLRPGNIFSKKGKSGLSWPVLFEWVDQPDKEQPMETALRIQPRVSKAPRASPGRVYAYLRVSTDRQELDSQRLGILGYA